MPILVILAAAFFIGEFVTGGLLITTAIGATAGAVVGGAKGVGRSAVRAHLNVKKRAAKHWYTKAAYSVLSATVATATEVLVGAAKGVVPGVRVAHRKRRVIRKKVIAKVRHARSAKAATDGATEPATDGATEGATEDQDGPATEGATEPATDTEEAGGDSNQAATEEPATDATEPATDGATEGATEPATDSTTESVEPATDGPSGDTVAPATGTLGDTTTGATEPATDSTTDTTEDTDTDEGENDMSIQDAADRLSGAIVDAEDKGLAGMLAGWDSLAAAFREFSAPFAEFAAQMAAFAEANEDNDNSYEDTVGKFQSVSIDLSELEDALSSHADELHTTYDAQVEELERNAEKSKSSGELLGEV